MVVHPSSPEFTLSEIGQLKQRLENPSRKKRLQEVQKAIVHILENAPELKGHFKNVYPREEIKMVASVLEKINDHRRDGRTSYDLDCLEDLIGAQMLCPYPDDLKIVLDWLYSRRGGRVYFKLVTNRRPLKKRNKKERTRLDIELIIFAYSLNRRQFSFAAYRKGLKGNSSSCRSKHY